MPVYTGRGDGGETDLRGGKRVSKADPRIESYGTVDELNALVGMARPSTHPDIDEILADIQNDLHVLQASLANTEQAEPQLTEADIARVESAIDTFQQELAPLQSFILPGGGDEGARFHHIRTVCRRAERRVIALSHEDTISAYSIPYLNRLSDLLFVVGRVANARADIPEESPTY